ncbi:uncharacterized protein BDV17DRAFT_287281 [Aspergillus undulatus]|uniref:uncharacterized protein n=1 Tax=Aspergillus undulatus TaxID=1810928 RepID=UPI003CCCDFD1
MADIHAKKVKKMAQAQEPTAAKPAPAGTATKTKTCIKCARSYPEDQFLSKRGGAPVKLCDPCRNASRISHKKRRARQAAEKEAKKARAESMSSAPARSPVPVSVSASPAPASTSPSPQVAPYFESPGSDTSPGRMLMQNLSNVANHGEMYPDPEPISSYGEVAQNVSEAMTPCPTKQRFSSTAPSSPFLDKSDTHENLLAKFSAKPKNNDFSANAQDLGVHLSVPRFGMHKVPVDQRAVKEEIGLRSPTADSRYGGSSAASNEHHTDLHFDQALDNGEVVRVNMSIVCRFFRYRTRN